MSKPNHWPVSSVGIDVSKDKLDLAMLGPGCESQLCSFENNSQGVKQIISLLQKQETAKTVPCVIESTGDFHLLSTIMITQAGFNVNCINPLITKKYQRSSIRKAKNDRIDAKRLAQIGLLEPDLRPAKCAKDQIISKKIISHLASLEATKQQLSASVKNFETTQKVLKFKTNLSAVKSALKSIDRQINLLRQRICCQAPPAAKELGKIKGLSVTQISILLSALADKQFETRDQLVAFVGLDVAVKQSGKWQGQQKLSKRGNPYLRKVLYQIAWSLKQNNEYYQKYYHRLYHEEGKHYTTTMIAVARKFLKFLFAYYWKKTICPQQLT